MTHRHMWEGIVRGCAAQDTLESNFHQVLFGIGPELLLTFALRSEFLAARTPSTVAA